MTKNSTTKKEKENPQKLKKEEKVKKYRYVKESDNLRRFDYRGGRRRRRRRMTEGQSFREMGKKTQTETEKTLFPRIGNVCNGNTENRYIWVFLPVFFFFLIFSLFNSQLKITSSAGCGFSFQSYVVPFL